MYVESIDWSWLTMGALLFASWCVVLWLLVRDFEKTKRIRRLETHRRVLQGAVEDARQTFKRYARLHFAKRTTDADAKGYANEQLAMRMEKALKLSGYRILGPLQSSFAHLRDQVQQVFPHGR
jgi:hypothetical protein